MNEQVKPKSSDSKYILEKLKELPPNGKFQKMKSDQIVEIVKTLIKDNEMMDYELCNCGLCVRRLKPLEVKEVITTKNEQNATAAGDDAKHFR